MLAFANTAVAWLFKGVTIDPTVLLIGAAVAVVLWIATMRRGEVPPPRCSKGADGQ